jgi:hypothetical protein
VLATLVVLAGPARREHFATPNGGGRRARFAGAAASPPGNAPPDFPYIGPALAKSGPYPGAIDGDLPPLWGPEGGDQAALWGHPDRVAGPPAEGSPYDTDRIGGPWAPGPCAAEGVGGSVAIEDGDELLAYQGRARNDPERVWAGLRRRKALVERFAAEELDMEENKRWWGAHEV